MALKTLVKISNVTNLSDARYCAGMGVDMLGFSMDADSPDYVAPTKFAEIRGWLAGVQIVGETRSVDPESIEQLLETYRPDLLQVDEAALLPYLSTLGTSDRELRFILRADVAQMTLDQLDTLLQTGAANADYVLLESNGPVNMEDELKTLLQRQTTRYSILLGTGISAENVHELLAELSAVRGIALSGGIEEQPGNKEFGELMDILEAIEEE
ncbi:phosphoribosylanthranilate isomerase [Spirosoma radiotolerans]|uniref:N-(5'-phosphoribosyl)anthranilate isomerase n=1 Tax=Spirosoma radiotolerans TaxID=1379870 RepID=A0A0E3ZWE0_9BACT|nr:N-(5'-phosphoribosyl)anthranilate isomerase [Spirosoma radiotolerans]AKD56598.1 N-(5'-phosphoribosyl)anthranilate isomerase [Spirosoma radiotolerans]